MRPGTFLTILALAAACLVLAGYQPASAENWKLFYETEKQKYYYDNDTVQRPTPTTLRVSQKVVEKAPEETEVDRAKREIEIDCKQKAFRITSNIEYDVTTGTETKAQQSQSAQYRTDLYSGVIAALIENLCPVKR